MSDPAPVLVRNSGGPKVVAPGRRSEFQNRSRPFAPSRSWAESRIAACLVDMLLVSAVGLVVFSMRYTSAGHIRAGVPASHYLGFLILYAGLVGMFCQNQGLYQAWRTTGPLDESFAVLKAVTMATLLLTTFIYLSGDKLISRFVVASVVLLTAMLLPAWRFWKREIIKRRVASGRDGRHILIVGAGEVGQALAEHFEKNQYLGYVVKGFLDENAVDDPRVVGSVSELPRLALVHFVDEIFITMPSQREMVDNVVLQAREHNLDVKVVPELFDRLGWRCPIGYIGDFPVMELLRKPIPALGLFTKRVIDIVGSVAALVILSPILCLIAIAIKLDSDGPPIYRSSRAGWRGRKFLCYKFRTMVANADELKAGVRHMNEREGPFFKITNDPRLTRFGKLLRRYSLDELPQFLNVLQGDMSLVGPRPHPLDDYEQYQIEHLRRLDVRPGITGLWQVYARTDSSFDRNLSLDLEYIENWNLWLDVKILIKTLPAALAGSGQ